MTEYYEALESTDKRLSEMRDICQYMTDELRDKVDVYLRQSGALSEAFIILNSGFDEMDGKTDIEGHAEVYHDVLKCLQSHLTEIEAKLKTKRQEVKCIEAEQSVFTQAIKSLKNAVEEVTKNDN